MAEPQLYECFKVVLDMPKSYGGEGEEIFVQSVSGFEINHSPEEYQEGGNNRGSVKLTSNIKFPNLSFKRCLTTSQSNILKYFQDWSTGECTARIASGRIQALNSQYEVVGKWSFENAIPGSWKQGSFDASKSELAFEEFELCHEGLSYEPVSSGTTDKKDK